MTEAHRARWREFLARVERRAQKRVLISAPPARFAELRAGLASLGYAVINGTEPDRLVQLVHDSIPAGALDAALTQVATYATGIGPNHRLVDARLVALAHAKGLVVHPYTVNDEARMSELVALGVDGLFTDRPDRLRALVRARGASR